MNKSLNDRRSGLKREEGFTLIELLVVVLIIGILAAIAIPVFLGVQENAKKAAVTSDLTNAKVAIIAYFTDDPDAATIDDAELLDTTLKAFGYTPSTGVTLVMDTVADSAGAAFCIDGSHIEVSSDAIIKHVTADGGVEDGPCTVVVVP